MTTSGAWLAGRGATQFGFAGGLGGGVTVGGDAATWGALGTGGSFGSSGALAICGGLGGGGGAGLVSTGTGGGVGWGAPAAIRIEGGSFGLQAGVSSTDLILLVMNERGMKRLMTSKFTLGAEATAAGGPVGRNVTAQTDALLMAEILSWSRARGLFAGISLDGSTLRNDIDENEAMYGQRWDNKQILTTRAKAPAAASRLIAELNKYSPRQTH